MFHLLNFLIFFPIYFLIPNIIFFILFVILINLSIYKLKPSSHAARKNTYTISFIHPFCADCGGGEKVLWCMLDSLLKTPPPPSSASSPVHLHLNIIAGVKDDAALIKDRILKRFNISFPANSPNTSILSITIKRLNSAYMLKPSPHFTMLFQILGQIYFSYEILTKVHSDAFYDTTGLPFTYLLLKLFNKKIFAYVHYPFISYDMINEVKRGIAGVHSRSKLAALPFVKDIKVFYYTCILMLYKLCGMCVSYAQCNSSWTYNHMIAIWNRTKLEKLFPPCSTSNFSECANNRNRRNVIVSFAQFRPEKDHIMQVRIMERIKKIFGNEVELHMIGGVRDTQQDKDFFTNLQNEIDKRNLNDVIKMFPNDSIAHIKSEFMNARIGIHTMKNEHFGISIIEMMSAGLIVIAHNSAGAKDDIIGPSKLPVGYLVEDEDHYVTTIESIINSTQYDPKNLMERMANSIERSKLFSDDSFVNEFMNMFTHTIMPLI